MTPLRNFVGRHYPGRHGCFLLAKDVYRETYGITAPDHSEGLPQGQGEKALYFLKVLRKTCIEVDNKSVREGDLVIFNEPGVGKHIGLIVVPGKLMMHVGLRSEEVVVEDYTDARRWNRIDGFYRYIGERGSTSNNL